MCSTPARRRLADSSPASSRTGRPSATRRRGAVDPDQHAGRPSARARVVERLGRPRPRVAAAAQPIGAANRHPWPSTCPRCPARALDHLSGRRARPARLGARGRAPPRGRGRRADRPRPPAGAAPRLSAVGAATARLRAAVGQGAGLVEEDGARPAEVLDRPPPLTMTRSARRARRPRSARSAPPGSAGRGWRRPARPGPVRHRR